MGIFALLAILYGTQEKIDFILNGPSNPILNFMSVVFNGNAGLVSFFSILLCLSLYFCGAITVTVTSRTGYSMARDQALPYSNYLK